MPIKMHKFILSATLSLVSACISFQASEATDTATVAVHKFYSVDALLSKTSGEIGVDYWQKTPKAKQLYDHFMKGDEHRAVKKRIEEILGVADTAVIMRGIPEISLYAGSDEVQFIADVAVNNLWSRDGHAYVLEVKPQMILNAVASHIEGTGRDQHVFAEIIETAALHLPLGWALEDINYQSEGKLFNFTMQGETKKDAYIVTFSYTRYQAKGAEADQKASLAQLEEIRDNGVYRIWKEGFKSEVKVLRPELNLQLVKRPKRLEHKAPPGYKNEKEKEKPSQ